jgi:hypothetical protein
MENQIMDAPASPEEVPGIEQEGEQELSQEEMRGNLDDIMSKINEAYSGFDTQNFVSQANKKEYQSAVMQELYDVFESMGIDPTNVEEVKEFLDRIKEKRPDLYVKIEKILTEIMDNSEEPEEVAE